MDTSDNVTDLILRLTLAAVFFPHGAQKALGWFGGYGFTASLGFFTGDMGIPTALAVLAIGAEFLGSLGLFVGLFARVAAFGIFCNMAVAVAMVHYKMGFFMNWAGQMPAGNEGFEYHILALALAFAVMVRGAGPVSLDRVLSRKR
ncbi:MAG TPA: DoxX family protein [Patescibacteria group bacterium]|nr:DoxX family protein [Patescibacteria group bacterium]